MLELVNRMDHLIKNIPLIFYPFILELCSLVSKTYYFGNYAGIFVSTLVMFICFGGCNGPSSLFFLGGGRGVHAEKKCQRRHTISGTGPQSIP